jgi:hypothetical protein
MNLTIVSGNITAISSWYGSGIGSGRGQAGNSIVMNLTIVSGNITASGSSYGAGIGSGSATAGGASTVAVLSILGGTIRANGTLAGIGSGGNGGAVGRVIFSGTAALICNGGPGKFAVSASSIVLSNASVIFGTAAARLFGVSPSREGPLSLAILYGSVTSSQAEPLSSLNAPILQIGNVSFHPPREGDCVGWTFCVSASDAENCIAAHFTEVREVKSVVLSIPSLGSYSIRALLDGSARVLETPDESSLLTVSSNFSFIPVARFVFPPRSATALPSSTETFTVPLRGGFRSERTLIFRFSFFSFPLWL